MKQTIITVEGHTFAPVSGTKTLERVKSKLAAKYPNIDTYNHEVREDGDTTYMTFTKKVGNLG